MLRKSCAKRGKEKEQLREARLWNGDEKRGFASEWWRNELISAGIAESRLAVAKL